MSFVDGLVAFELGPCEFKLGLGRGDVFVALPVVDQMELLFGGLVLIFGDFEVAPCVVEFFLGDHAGVEEFLTALEVATRIGLDGFSLLHRGEGLPSLLRTRAVEDFVVSSLSLMNLGAAGLDLGQIVVVDEHSEDLALLNLVTFLGENLLELAGDLRAYLDVFRVRLDEARTSNYGLGDERLRSRGGSGRFVAA